MNHTPRHGAGVEKVSNRDQNDYAPRHKVPASIIDDIDWATGRNGMTTLAQLREQGLDVVRVKA